MRSLSQKDKSMTTDALIATIIVYFYDNKKSNVQLTQFLGTKIAFVIACFLQFESSLRHELSSVANTFKSSLSIVFLKLKHEISLFPNFWPYPMALGFCV